jgi:hypothetical protein
MLFKSIKNSFATLVIAEHNGKKLTNNTLKMLSATKKLNDKSHVLIFGEDSTEVTKSIQSTVPSDVV